MAPQTESLTGTASASGLPAAKQASQRAQAQRALKSTPKRRLPSCVSPLGALQRRSLAFASSPADGKRPGWSIDRAKLRNVFDQTDTDGNGWLSIEEVTAVFKQLDIHKTPDEIQRLFDEMNPNGDGQVGFEEFAETIQRQIANGGSVAHLFKEASQFYNFINPGFGTDPNAEEAAASSPSAPVVYVWKRCFLFIPIVLVWPLMIMLVWWDLPGSYHSLLLTEPIQEGRPLQ